MSILCIYHNDADGRASAAIVRHALGEDVQLHQTNYDEPIPWELINHSHHVVIVDFSLSRSDMVQIASRSQLTWIDHHISAINELEDISNNWSGIHETNEAACVLTWKYYFPEKQVPRAIILIGDRDIWKLAESDSKPFAEGFRQLNSHPENDQLWTQLFENNIQLISQIIDRGRILYNARIDDLERIVSRYGFPVKLEGHKTLAINHRGSGDLGQLIRDIGYKIAYCYIDGVQNDKLVTFVTLFSDQVDVSEIARKFGGGGHRGAAGFTMEQDHPPFPPDANIFLKID
jgi:oligoribonuclease NrnB/cAMP/cGMP phosphodiesterase (DHH superfamily)